MLKLHIVGFGLHWMLARCMFHSVPDACLSKYSSDDGRSSMASDIHIRSVSDRDSAWCLNDVSDVMCQEMCNWFKPGVSLECAKQLLTVFRSIVSASK